MTRRWPCILFVLCCLPALVASASAECAWVLWQHILQPASAIRPGRCTGAYPTVPACTKAIDEEEVDARSGSPFLDITRKVPTDLLVMGKGAKWGREGLCLPDTVDPALVEGEEVRRGRRPEQRPDTQSGGQACVRELRGA